MKDDKTGSEVLVKKLDKKYDELTHKEKILNHYGDFFEEYLAHAFELGSKAELPSHKERREMFEKYIRKIYNSPSPN